MSLPEVLLWRELRKRPGGFKWRKQHPAGPFSLDFACLAARLAIEIDGEAHDRGSSPAYDEARDEWLMAQGYRTWRIPARDVLTDLDAVVRYAVHLAEQCQPLHRPSGGPPPRSGEVF
jgi:very-short-patch-repair endonuclease